MAVVYSLNHLFEELTCSHLVKGPFVKDLIEKLASRAVFHDKEDVVLAVIDLNKFYHIRMV